MKEPHFDHKMILAYNIAVMYLSIHMQCSFERDESEVKRNYLYNMHKICNVVWQ